MKVKELKRLLDKFGDGEEITFLAHWWDGDQYEGAMIAEESPQAIVYLTEHGTVMLVPSDADLGQVKKKFKGMTMHELISTVGLIKSKNLWLKLLEEPLEGQETK